MNDLEFVRALTRGDKQAWGTFVEKYSRLIYRYIHGTLKLKGRRLISEETAEIFHDIIVSLSRDNFAKLKTYRAKNGCSLASWLRQVAVNYSIDHLRRRKETISLDQEEPGESSSLKETLADNSPSGRDELFAAEKILQLKECIADLDLDERLLLELNISQQLPLEKIIRLFRASRAALDMRKSRILKKLKECFRRKGYLLDF